MKKIYIAVIVAVVIVFTGLAFFNNFWQNPAPQDTIGLPGVQKTASLIIDYGTGEPQVFEMTFTEKITAFDLLESKTEEAGIALKTEMYDIGVMVERIGDTESGQDGKYWLYYINGQMPDVAADKKELNSGDKVEFKFEKSSF